MSRISRLDEITINKIAAGEVIENPASVVKELVENALDAGATEITVEILGGGRELIRISDNGCGMNRSDALLSIERYATSKISSVEDIFALNTMGFRGEALASIVSIAKVTLLTFPKDGSNTGTLILCEGGKIVDCSNAIRDPGTTIEVKSLFFNLPVRKKFLSSPAYDAQQIHKLLSIIALAYPTVHFRLISNEKLLLNTPIYSEKYSLKERVGHVLGKEQIASSFYLQKEADGYALEGFFSYPHSTRPNKTGQYLFINKRAVTSFAVASAVRSGYGTALAEGRHPLWVLYLTIPAGYVDVNVHPQKKEVRLRQEDLLKELIVEAIRRALLPKSASFPSSPNIAQPAMPFQSPYRPSPSFSYTPTALMQNVIIRQIEREADPIMDAKLAIPEAILHEEPIERSHLNFIQDPTIVSVMRSYIVLDPSSAIAHPALANILTDEDSLLLVDIKAAMAKIALQGFIEAKSKGSQTAQRLLLDIEISLSAVEGALLESYLPALEKSGFLLQKRAETIFSLQAVPTFLQQIDLAEFIRDFVAELEKDQNMDMGEQLEKLLIAAFLRQQQRQRRTILSLEEAKIVVQQLLLCPMPSRSVDGRATLIQLTEKELTNRFNK
jgi:DNA mismatch repair protein MutL